MRKAKIVLQQICHQQLTAAPCAYHDHSMYKRNPHLPSYTVHILVDRHHTGDHISSKIPRNMNLVPYSQLFKLAGVTSKEGPPPW